MKGLRREGRENYKGRVRIPLHVGGGEGGGGGVGKTKDGPSCSCSKEEQSRVWRGVRLGAMAVGSLEVEVLTRGWLTPSLPVGVESFAESEEEVAVWEGDMDVGR